jgi:hypothetical protein
VFAVAFLRQGHAAKFDRRLPSCFFRRHSGAQIVFHVEGQMAFQLFGEFTLAPPAMEQTEEPHQPAA